MYVRWSTAPPIHPLFKTSHRHFYTSLLSAVDNTALKLMMYNVHILFYHWNSNDAFAVALTLYCTLRAYISRSMMFHDVYEKNSNTTCHPSKSVYRIFGMCPSTITWKLSPECESILKFIFFIRLHDTLMWACACVCTFEIGVSFMVSTPTEENEQHSS